MILNKIIAHEIVKESGTTSSTLNLCEELIPIDQNSIDLVSALLKSYQGDKILYAEFDQSPGHYFPQLYRGYASSNRTDSEFIGFTIEATGNLESLIQNEIFARGGYVVYTEYELNQIQFISIFLIRDTTGKLLNRNGNTFQIENIQYLDTNHLAMACRINENKLTDGDSNYLSFTTLKQAEVSDYFRDWIAIQQFESSADFTKKLYDIINQLPVPINTETNTEYTIDEVRNRVYDLIKSNPSGNINLNIIGEHIYGDRGIITNYAEINSISIDTEYRSHNKSLKKFIQVNIVKDGITLKYSRGDNDTKVRISEDNPNMVIIESVLFANALRQEISTNE